MWSETSLLDGLILTLRWSEMLIRWSEYLTRLYGYNDDDSGSDS